jgi:predicted lipoprotein with Yx(FWY)xxD motif
MSNMHANRIFFSAVAVAAALALGACGSSSDDTSGGSGSADTSASSSQPASGNATVAVQSVDGVGDVLVDADGMALYTPDQEADGSIVCTGGCTSFWIPLAASGGKPTADGDAGKLGVIRRPDGTMQVTANGKPLYTFSQDGAGQVTGDGFSDDFDGTHFTWHAVVAGGTPSGGSGGDNASGAGGGASSGSGGDGYDSGDGYNSGY